MDIYVINSADYQFIEKTVLKNFCYKKYASEKKQYLHSLAYFLLDKILKDKYNIENRKIVFKENKPCLFNNKKYFSLSHSYDYIAIAISDFNCGVDIEKNKERDYDKISKRMGFTSDNLKDFYTNWTLYEANYKLSDKSKKCISRIINNYTISAVSVNNDEEFNINIS